MPTLLNPQSPVDLGRSTRQTHSFPQLAVLLIRGAAVLGACIGVTAMAGWIGDWPSLRSVLPGAVEMKANTALGLMVAGCALWLLDIEHSTMCQRWGKVMALCVAAIGLSTLSQYLFGWRLGIDQFLFDDTASAYNAIRGRMSPYTAGAFSTLGLALLILPRPRMSTAASMCASTSLLIGVISLVGYTWNATELTTDTLVPPVALNTAVALALLSAGTLLAIRRRTALSTTSVVMTSIERKVLTGFAISFVLLALGFGISYKATTVFADSGKVVAHTQEVRAVLGQLHSDMSEAGLTQRNYLISGRPEQLDQYRSLMSKVDRQVEALRSLVSDNPRQLEALATLRLRAQSARAFLDEGAKLYQTTGFAGVKKLVDSGQGLQAVRAVLLLVETMESVEEQLLVERQATSDRFGRFTAISMLLTMIAAAGIFAALYRQIRLEIRARHLADEALVSARDAAELLRHEADVANRAKSTFLATMSHEIRTPMNGMLGMLELLGLSQLDSGQHATLKVIRESGRSLIRIIDDILDFSKMEALKLEIQPEVVSLKHLVEDFHCLYAGNASSKGLTIACRVDTALSPAVLADPIRLRQILNNLVSNAIKFTSHGQIDISADLIERSPTQEKVRLSVRDTGIGISEEHQRRLFQPFAQAESSTASRYGGSGLGLAICQRLAHLMGGTVQMTSAPGKGTTMMLELWFPVADPALLPARESGSSAPSLFATAGLRREHPGVAEAAAEGTLVLLVDDHPTNRTLLLRQVNLLGYAAECARNGVEALALWESGRFNLLLTDCNMPEMDGYELTRVIRAREEATGARRLPIVACTANALAGEVEICLNAGMDDYLAKPIELSTLLPKLERWLPLPRTTAPAPEPAPHAPATRAKPPIDHAALARVSGGDASVEREIFVEFQLANDEDVALLQRAVRAVDSKEVKRLTHLIRGASTMVGALTLAGLCERIEQANQHKDWVSIQSCARELEREVAGLNLYFSELRQAAGLP